MSSGLGENFTRQYQQKLKPVRVNEGPLFIFDGEILSILKYAGPNEKTPIRDALHFIRKLKRGDFNSIMIDESMPIHCAILGEINDNLREEAEYCNLNSMKDSLGYYGFHKKLGAYISVLGNRFANAGGGLRDGS